jgi:hypothetical protein
MLDLPGRARLPVQGFDSANQRFEKGPHGRNRRRDDLAFGIGFGDVALVRNFGQDGQTGFFWQWS